MKLGISSYSYWHFREPKVPIETVIDKASALGASGVDVLHQQMESEDKAYLQRLKRRAFVNGINLINLSIHQNFVSPDAHVRQEHIDHTLRCIDIAYRMGIPCIRINSGRWGTIKSFDDLMAQGGNEPPLPGYKEEDAFSWCIDALERCLPRAEECGVILALENHWGLTQTPDGVLRIVNAIRSPWLGVLMDTGNFLEEPYEKLEMLAPKAVFVHAKAYDGGGEWYTLDLDYRRVAAILANVDYRGYVSLEFEGKEDPDSAVPRNIVQLRQTLGAY